MDQTISYGLSDAEMQNIAQLIHTMDTEEFSAELQISLKKVEDHVKTLLQPDDALKQRIHQLEAALKDLKQTASTPNKGLQGNQNKQTKTPSSHATLEHDAIFIGDSNTRDIDMSQPGYGTSRKTIHFVHDDPPGDGISQHSQQSPPT